jgi:hypothetical protein
MLFVRTFKGYEDRHMELDDEVNRWLAATKAEVVDIKVVLSHENNSRARSGDLLMVVLYKADQPLPR